MPDFWEERIIWQNILHETLTTIVGPLQLQVIDYSRWSFPAKIFSQKLTTMRNVSFVKILANLDANLYPDWESLNFLTIEIQSNLNLLRNGSYVAKSIECSNYKQGRTFFFIKQVWNKIIQFFPCHVLFLSFGRILSHIEHFIEERCSFYFLSMDTPCFQDGRCN